MQKIKLIYIVSAPHSGSTLLDLILGSQSKIESVGEIINLEKWVNNNKDCTCGQKLTNCNYWKTILEKYKETIGAENKSIYDLITLFKSITKKDKLLFYFFNNPSFVWDKDEIKKYGLKNYYLFKTIKEHTGKPIILDSSKEANRILKLYLSDLFEVKIIYLFRDGRANIESFKRKASDAKRDKAKYYGPVSHTIKFILGHLIQSRILKSIDKKDVFFLDYKNFAMHPKNVIQDICRFIGIEFNEETFDLKSSKYFSNQKHHNIGGNRLRLKFIEKITYKNKWQENLSKKEKIIFHMLGGNIINKIYEKKAEKSKKLIKQ